MSKDSLAALLADAFSVAYGGGLLSVSIEEKNDCADEFRSGTSLTFTGTVNGLFSLSLKDADVHPFVAAMLRNFSIYLTVNDLDAVREFTNIYAAHLATGLAKNGLSLDISAPKQADTPPKNDGVLAYILTTTEGIEVLIRISINARDAEYVRNH